MRKKSSIALALILASVGFYFYACHNRDLRGWWKSSADGKTYLVIEDIDRPVETRFDGAVRYYVPGQRWEIEPGGHELDGIGFVVREGTEYHFDYWGP